MFRIKICGLTTIDDALAAVEAGADALGLNFYRKSVRFLDPTKAVQLVEAIPKGIVKVGLFVNEEVENVAKTFDSLQLDLIQLHGDESPEYCTQLGGRPVMKAFRLGSEGLTPVVLYLNRLRELGMGEDGSRGSGKQLSYVLLDSHVEGVYGGSGIPADWKRCAEYVKMPGNPPLVLAGGLKPENVARAIREVGPVAVDTASGVETSPGRKDSSLLHSFIQNARSAFLSNEGSKAYHG